MNYDYIILGIILGLFCHMSSSWWFLLYYMIAFIIYIAYELYNIKKKKQLSFSLYNLFTYYVAFLIGSLAQLAIIYWVCPILTNLVDLIQFILQARQT